MKGAKRGFQTKGTLLFMAGFITGLGLTNARNVGKLFLP